MIRVSEDLIDALEEIKITRPKLFACIREWFSVSLLENQRKYLLDGAPVYRNQGGCMELEDVLEALDGNPKREQ